MVFLLLVNALHAQKDHLEEADALFDSEKLTSAIDAYKRAYVKTKDRGERAYIKFKIGESHRLMANPGKAEEAYQAALDLRYEEHLVYLRIAEVQKQQAKYEKAKENYQQYADETGSKVGKEGVKSCDLALEMMTNETRYQVEEVRVLNTDNYDFSPLFADRRGTELIFTSNRPGSTGEEPNQKTPGGNKDLWITTQDQKKHWAEPRVLQGEVNTEYDEGAATVDRRGNLYFTRCKTDEKESLGCNIMFAEKKGRGYSTPEKIELKPDANDSLTVGHPTLSDDGATMIFAADFPGGQGGKDLWIVEYDRRERKWGTPENMGSTINTPGDELFPYLRRDGKLFFASNGHLGMGGLDLFQADKQGDENKWGGVKNMGAPINSHAHDYGIIFESDNKRGLFTSNRKGGTQDDIFSFMLPEIKFSLVVQVIDEDSKEPIPGAEIEVRGDNNTSYSMESDENGMYTFETNDAGTRYIQSETNYEVDVGKTGKFLTSTQAFTTKGEESSKKFILVYELTSAQKPIRLPEVRYPYDEDYLQVIPDSVNSKDSLNYLYDIMINNPTIVVKLMSHTDCRGSAEYNRDLAQRRAESCVRYLVDEKGIPSERLVPVGMGEDDPIEGLECDAIKELPTEQEREAAHQKNRRTNAEIISWDYVPEEEDGEENNE